MSIVGYSIFFKITNKIDFANLSKTYPNAVMFIYLTINYGGTFPKTYTFKYYIRSGEVCKCDSYNTKVCAHCNLSNIEDNLFIIPYEYRNKISVVIKNGIDDKPIPGIGSIPNFIFGVGKNMKHNLIIFNTPEIPMANIVTSFVKDVNFCDESTSTSTSISTSISNSSSNMVEITKNTKSINYQIKNQDKKWNKLYKECNNW